MKEKVLIVADDIVVSELAKSVLQHEGYNVYVTLPVGAMDMIADISPDLVIIDHTEEKNGSTLCLQLKGSEQFAGVPVLLMSPVRELGEVFDQFLADDFIYRPYILRLLIDKVSRLLAA